VFFSFILLSGLKMSMTNESSWVGRKAVKRIGGMSDALSIAADLGFTVSSTPSSTSSHEPPQISSPTNGEKGEDLIRVLRELTSVQRKIADLQVELQGRKV
jgi:HAUS augmin-like complex subunit 2